MMKENVSKLLERKDFLEATLKDTEKKYKELMNDVTEYAKKHSGVLSLYNKLGEKAFESIATDYEKVIIQTYNDKVGNPDILAKLEATRYWKQELKEVNQKLEKSTGFYLLESIYEKEMSKKKAECKRLEQIGTKLENGDKDGFVEEFSDYLQGSKKDEVEPEKQKLDIDAYERNAIEEGEE